MQTDIINNNSKVQYEYSRENQQAFRVHIQFFRLISIIRNYGFSFMQQPATINKNKEKKINK